MAEKMMMSKPSCEGRVAKGIESRVAKGIESLSRLCRLFRQTLISSESEGEMFVMGLLAYTIARSDTSLLLPSHRSSAMALDASQPTVPSDSIVVEISAFLVQYKHITLGEQMHLQLVARGGLPLRDVGRPCSPPQEAEG
jgi:hypothetical protein